MKRIILLFALSGLLSGCAWFKGGQPGGAGTVSADMAGPDSGMPRGTTGVSSGADSAPGTTGSDLAPR